MKLYAVRDRMVDYFMTPFPGPTDKEVLASLAATINNPEITHAIAQAPHFFELWRLAEVTEDGHIVESRELLADCAALIRPGVRASATRGRPTIDPEAAAEAIERVVRPGGADEQTPPGTAPIPDERPSAAEPPPVRNQGH